MSQRDFAVSGADRNDPAVALERERASCYAAPFAAILRRSIVRREDEAIAQSAGAVRGYRLRTRAKSSPFRELDLTVLDESVAPSPLTT